MRVWRLDGIYLLSLPSAISCYASVFAVQSMGAGSVVGRAGAAGLVIYPQEK
jgi:hypothetical protein